MVTNAGSCSNTTTPVTPTPTVIVNTTIINITTVNITTVNETNHTRRALDTFDTDTYSADSQAAIQEALSKYYGMPVVVQEYRQPNSTCINDTMWITSFLATEVPRQGGAIPGFPAFIPVAISGLQNQSVALSPNGDVDHYAVKSRIVSNQLQNCPNNHTDFQNEAERVFYEQIQNDLRAVPLGITTDTTCDNNKLVSDMTAIVLLPSALSSPNITNMTFPATGYFPSQSAAVSAAPILVGQQALGQPCGGDGDCAASTRRADSSVSCQNNVCSGGIAASSCCAALDCDHRIKNCETSDNGNQCRCKLNGKGIALIVILSVFGCCLFCLLLPFLLLFRRGKSPQQGRRADDPGLRAPHLERVQA